MPKLFVSYVVYRSNPPEFGNFYINASEPKTMLEVKKLDLKLQNLLTELNDKLTVPVILSWKKLEG